jgi:hypothetical protein
MSDYPQVCERCGCTINSFKEVGRISLVTPLKYYCVECDNRKFVEEGVRV